LPDLPQELVVLVRVASAGKSKQMTDCSQILACQLSDSPVGRLQAQTSRPRCLTGLVVPFASQATLAGGRRVLPSDGSVVTPRGLAS